MAVMRVEKSTNYTVMSNRHLDDTRLSLKAIGLLSKILRLPDDWDYTLEGLAHICKEGKDAIRSAIVELEQAGCDIIRVAVPDARGGRIFCGQRVHRARGAAWRRCATVVG